MNFFLFSACFVSFVLIIASQISTEYVKEVQDYCKAKEGASDEDKINVSNGTIPETRAEKCLAACLAERYGTQDS